MKRYIVTLTEDEREALRQLVSKGKGAARKLLYAHLLLKADTAIGWTDQAIVEAFDVSVSTVERVRQRFVEDGLTAALERQAPKRCQSSGESIPVHFSEDVQKIFGQSIPCSNLA